MKKKVLLFIIFAGIVALLTGLGIWYYFYTHPKCPKGYDLVADKCRKVVRVEPTEEYYCIDGYTLEGSRCIKTESILGTKNYYCKAYSSSANVQVSAPTLLGDMCQYRVTHQAIERKSCLAGCYLQNDYTCVCNNGMKLIPNTSRECISGFSLVGYTCQKYDLISASYTISCPNGYTPSGDYCNRQVSNEPLINYICPDGYEQVGATCRQDILIDTLR